jgi:hypothetical protein
MKMFYPSQRLLLSAHAQRQGADDPLRELVADLGAVDGDVDRVVPRILAIPGVPEDTAADDDVIRVFCTNAEVQACTAKCLGQLEGEEIRLCSVDTDVQGKYTGARAEAQLASILDATDLERVLYFKNGARAMLRQSVNKHATGTVGIIRFDGTALHFRTSKGVEFEVLRLTRDVHEHYDGEPVATREQYPVTLAYAMTVHKLQGATTTAEVHAVLTRWTCWGTLEERRRMLYVVLSRATEYANVRLVLPSKGEGALERVLLAGLADRQRLWEALKNADLLQ